MVVATTFDITVSVETIFQPNYASSANRLHVFAYEICIENCSEHPVQLLHRYWQIFDGPAAIRLVNGPGVVGENPIIQAGETHSYISFCDFYHNIGMMRGKYLMKRLHDQSTFLIRVSSFTMVTPYLLN